MSEIITKRRPHGFFSDCHWVLIRLSNAVRKSKKIPTIDTTNSFFVYKTKDELETDTDIWPRFFTSRPPEDLSEVDGTILNVAPANIMYKADFTNNLDLINSKASRAMFINMFSPSNYISRCSNKLIQKYNIDISNSCYIYYRGNDKLRRESKDVPIDRYIESINNVRQKSPDCKLIIQTDVNDFFVNIKDKFDNVVMFDETWAGINKDRQIRTAIHYDLQHNDANKKNIMALVSSMLVGAQAKYVISNTSGFSLFLQLYRCLVFDRLSADTDTILYTRCDEHANAERHLPQFK